LRLELKKQTPKRKENEMKKFYAILIVLVMAIIPVAVLAGSVDLVTGSEGYADSYLNGSASFGTSVLVTGTAANAQISSESLIGGNVWSCNPGGAAATGRVITGGVAGPEGVLVGGAAVAESESWGNGGAESFSGFGISGGSW